MTIAGEEVQTVLIKRKHPPRESLEFKALSKVCFGSIPTIVGAG